ncbi:inactive serine/threonine-protein kinase TEX14-like isoform X2 [Balaenoptera musculus]|uniref:Inactive serine/threonine-protein kinase TEX14-like isoform X2 n=1 Tax=Balaenoptera musculus TaxID=9771 RepID=A0A8B8VVE5_BALMU|nr:inactive serine/threonine-protein kinase TEX14-like isoform X2 [Balaenoptera musculus]
MPSLRSRFPVELGSGIQEARWAVCIAWLWPGAQAGASPGSCGEVDGENSAGQTVLFLAALLGHSSAVQLLLAFGTSPNHRCLDGSTPVHAGAFSGCSLLVLHVLQAGGDLRLHDQQGRIPREWAEQGGAKQSWEVSRGWGGVRASGRAAHPASPHVPPPVRVLEPLQICCAHTSALVHGSELARTAPLGQLQASSGQSLCGGLRLTHTDRARRPEQIRTPQIPAFGFGQPQRSSLWPLGLVTGGPLTDLEELLPARGGPDCTYESSSHTLMANLPWRGHPVTVTVTVTVQQLKAPGAQPDVLMPDLQHCGYVTPALPPGQPSPAEQSPACPPDSSVSETEAQGVWRWPRLQSSPLGQRLA